jgi:hypothetical protein
MTTTIQRLELHPRQMRAFRSPAREILFGGASGGGKSHFLRVALISWCIGVPDLQCVLIRKRWDDILLNHLEGPTGFRALLAPFLAGKKVEITQQRIRFGNGSMIAFQHCMDERQFTSAQGVERHVLAIDEATQISERLIRFFRSWARASEDFKRKVPEQFKGFFPRVLYTANPVGPSVGFFRREFVKARPPEAIETVHGFPRQFIPSRVEHNPDIDAAELRGRLAGIGDPALAEALVTGSWDTMVGEFFPEWSEDRHVIPDLQPPAYLLHFRTFDWGTAEPACCHWWAVSDGEPIADLSGRKHWFPRGSLICYREWYVADPERPALGLRLRNEDLAYGILERSPMSHERRIPTLTDSLPFQDRGGLTIAETFANCGVLLTLADTSRVPGFAQMRSRLIGVKVDSSDRERTPLIFFGESCRAARDYIPALPRHPSENKREDAAEHGEATHACFVAGTMVRTDRGVRFIESLVEGDTVRAGDGESRPISAVGITRIDAAVVRLNFDNGVSITCTPDHRFLTPQGWRPASELQGVSCILGECESLLFQKQFRSLTGGHIDDTAATSAQTKRAFIASFGSTITDRFRKAFTFITGTTTLRTTSSRTSNFSPPSTISATTEGPTQTQPESASTDTVISPPRGTRARKVSLGIRRITRTIAPSRCTARFREYASIVERALRQRSKRVFAGSFVRSITPTLAIPIGFPAPALFARWSFTRASIAPRSAAGKVAPVSSNGGTVTCVEIAPAGRADVYCLTEPVTHSFQLASGLIVRNCDSVRYACMAHARVFDADRPDPDPKDISNAVTWNDALERHRHRRSSVHATW